MHCWPVRLLLCRWPHLKDGFGTAIRGYLQSVRAPITVLMEAITVTRQSILDAIPVMTDGGSVPDMSIRSARRAMSWVGVQFRDAVVTLLGRSTTLISNACRIETNMTHAAHCQM